MNIKLIKDQNELDTTIKSNKFVVVDFYADWCGPCKALAPIIEELAKTEGDVTFGKINVDNAQELAQKFGISSIPTLVYFKDGEEISERTFGFVPKPKLSAIISNLKK